MRKNKLTKCFIDTWVSMESCRLASCLSVKVKCFLPEKEIVIVSRKAFLIHAATVFQALKANKTKIIPICCDNGKYHELIYAFVVPVAISMDRMTLDEAEADVEEEISKVYVKTYVYLECNLFKVRKITFTNKKPEECRKTA